MDGPEFSVRNGEGANALDINQILELFGGRGIVSGGEIVDGSTSFTLSVMAVDVWFASDATEVEESIQSDDTTVGERIQRPSANIDLRDYVDDTHPRKVLVCVPRDENGNAGPYGDNNSGPYHIVAGEPKVAKPSDFNEFYKTSQPSLPDLSDEPDLVPLGAVWIGANANEVTESNIWSRRQRPDASLRDLFLSKLIVSSITDGAGVVHESELADAENVTSEAILDIVDSDPDHGEDAQHDYRTDDEILGVVRDTVDLNELSAANGSNGEIILVSDDGEPYYALPPDEWGDLQALIDAIEADGDTPEFDSLTVSDITITGSETYPDGTVETNSPNASAGNVTTLATLGDVQKGPLSDKHDPSGSGDVYVTTDEHGVLYDAPGANPERWTTISHNASDISPSDLGFDPTTQNELEEHTETPDAHHSKTPEYTDDQARSAIDGMDIDITGDAATVGDTPPSGFVSSTDDDEIAGRIDYTTRAAITDTARSANEVNRYGGQTSDYLLEIQNGDGRVLQTWNGYYDGNDWRYLVSDEQAVQTRITTNGEYQIRTAPESLSDEVIEWRELTVIDGSVSEADHADSATNTSGGTVSNAKVINGTVNGSHSDFDTAQQAINFAEDNDYGCVEFGPGGYDSIIIHRNGMRIVGRRPTGTAGQTVFNGGSQIAINIQANTVRLERLAVTTTNTGAGGAIYVDGANVHIRDCRIDSSSQNGIYVRGRDEGVITECTSVTSNVPGSAVVLGKDTRFYSITGNTSLGDITDKSGNNSNAIGLNGGN